MIPKTILLILILFFTSCGNRSTENNGNTNLNSFETVQIGNQIWMKSNLNIEKFINGDAIQEAKTNEEWIEAGTLKKPAWCYYENDSKNGDLYGKLYNWYAVSDKRGLAPEGYHIPNDKEWDELFLYLGKGSRAGDRMRDTSNSKLKLTEFSNNSGFSALPSGFRYDPDFFYALGDNASWWTLTEVNDTDAYFCDLDFNMMHTVSKSQCPKIYGLSVRCLKDK